MASQFCCYCDVRAQQELSDRLLQALASQCVVRKIAAADALVKLRKVLLPDGELTPAAPTRRRSLSSAEADGLALLDARLEKAGSGKGWGDALALKFTSKDELLRKKATRVRELDAAREFSDSARAKFALELLQHYDLEKTQQ